jgi:C4-dicarboxylate-specific signal transduction histidine kinase
LLLKKNIPDDIRESLRMTYEGARRVAGITGSLLTFAHKPKPERTYVNINHVIGNTLALRARDMRNSSIQASMQLDPDVMCTFG